MVAVVFDIETLGLAEKKTEILRVMAEGIFLDTGEVFDVYRALVSPSECYSLEGVQIDGLTLDECQKAVSIKEALSGVDEFLDHVVEKAGVKKADITFISHLGETSIHNRVKQDERFWGALKKELMAQGYNVKSRGSHVYVEKKRGKKCQKCSKCTCSKRGGNHE